MDTNQIIAWSVAVAALAFVVLCGFLIALLRKAQSSLDTAQAAFREVKETVDGLQGEVRKLAGSVNDVASDVRGKLRSTDPLFQAVRDVGIILQEVTGTAREAAGNAARSLRKKSASPAGEGGGTPAWLKWAAIGSRIVTGIRNNAREKQGRTAYSRVPAKEGV